MHRSSAIRQSLADHKMEVSRAGREFDPAADRWVLSKDVTLNLGLALCRLPASLRDPYRAVMTHVARTYSPSYCGNLQGFLIPFLRQAGTDPFTTTALLNYRAGLGRSTEHLLGYVRTFLKHWHRLGYPGVTSEVMALLDSWTLKGNDKGAAVKSLDPLQGPLDDLELQAFNEKAAQEFEKGHITISTLAFALLLSHTGRRPGQLLLIRIGELFSGETPDGDPVHLVRIPRSKQRGQPPRSETKAFAITADLYRLVRAQADSVVKRVSEQFSPMPTDLIELLPLFPKWGRFQDISDANELEMRMQDDSLYETTKSMCDRLGKIRIYSHRIGGPISVSPVRFRYTQGSRAAREGFGEYVIAELLDHSDTQNAKVYTRHHPNFRCRVDAAVGQALIPLAQAYSGTLVDRESDAINGSDLTKRVRNDAGNVGTCGSQGFCGANPSACYPCGHFQPWLDAPHEIVLDRLLTERQRVLDLTGDEAVAGAQDRSILAVRQVIALCERRKAELEKANDE